MIGLLQENGPCSINRDSNSTTLNPWSWNQEFNMLYIGMLSLVVRLSEGPMLKSLQTSLSKLASATIPSSMAHSMFYEEL